MLYQTGCCNYQQLTQRHCIPQQHSFEFHTSFPTFHSCCAFAMFIYTVFIHSVQTEMRKIRTNTHSTQYLHQHTGRSGLITATIARCFLAHIRRLSSQQMNVHRSRRKFTFVTLKHLLSIFHHHA